MDTKQILLIASQTLDADTAPPASEVVKLAHALFAALPSDVAQAPQKSVATVRVTHKGYGMELSTYVAYALPEGKHDLYAAPVAAQAPEGWKLVPLKPTGDMLDAMLSPWHDGSNRGERETLEAAYAGVLAAAPQAPVADGARAEPRLTEDQWLALAERHVGRDWDARQPDGFLNAVKLLCEDFAAISMRPTDDALWDQTLRERDNYCAWADKLADAIATHLGVNIGEHSNVNNPWCEALEAIENAAGEPDGAYEAGEAVALSDAARLPPMPEHVLPDLQGATKYMEMWAKGEAFYAPKNGYDEPGVKNATIADVKKTAAYLAPRLRDASFALQDYFAAIEAAPAQQAVSLTDFTYATKQATNCAKCGDHRHTPLRIDWMGGYVCLTCIDKELEALAAKPRHWNPVYNTDPVQRACGDLPDGWEIEISLEKDAGTVDLLDPNGERIAINADGDCFDWLIHDAIDAALQSHSEGETR